MSSGLYSGTSGLALGAGLYRSVSGLWGGASGLINGFGGGFSPSTLFASGEPGVWADIDPAYMYQDSAGTTPVTAPGQTVGMVLDRSKGLVLGSERVSNGGFASGTDWTLDAGASIGSGLLTFASVSSTFGANQTLASSFSNGQFAQVTLKVDSITAGQFRVRLNGGTYYLVPTSPGTYTFYVQAGSGSNQLQIHAAGTTSGTIDNISVKELPGNHLTQSTLSNRAIYGIEPFGGRRNLLTYTEQFDNAAWTRQNINPFGSGSVANTTATTDPVGGNTADFIQESTANNIHWVEQSFTTAALTYAFSCYMKAATRNWGYLRIRLSGGADRAAFFNLSNGTIGTVQSGISAAITSVGNGWYRCEISTTTPIVGSNVLVIGVTTADNTTVYTGDGTSGIFIWGAQLELGSTATAYQRVTDQWDVTQSGLATVGYLQFDGSDDWLVSPTITPGIDKAQVFAGVRKLSDAATGVLLETGVNAGIGAGELGLYAAFPANGYTLRSRGTITADAASPTTFASPITNVLTGIGDIAADTSTLRVNGTQVATKTTDQGTGNYLAYPLYIGRRGGTTLPYNGRIYSLIVRFGANLDAATITQTENWVAGKTGIYTVDQLNRLNARTADGTLYSAYAAADASSNNYLVTNSVRAADGTSYNVI